MESSALPAAMYLRMSGAAEVLLRAAVVESPCQIAGVESVAFFIGENPLTDQTVTRSDI